MKKITTLIFGLILSSGFLFAQKIDYDNSSKWFLGLNIGTTWQTTDVANRNNVGWGLTLGKSFNYNYGKKLSFDIRARYLRGFWYGQDYDSTSLGSYTGGPLQAYKDSLGFSVNNFEADVHRLGLELVLHANGIRERSGWDPYIFGGIGFTWYQTFGDLYSNDTTGAIYGYDPAQISSKPYINSLLDGIYDSPLEGSNSSKYTMGVMPSLGFGIGYQVGKRVTLGLEHKTTFTLTDNFDGYTDGSSKYNDIYHYTSAYINFRFKTHKNNSGGTGGGTNNVNNVNNYNNNLNNCVTPTITYLNPNTNSLSVSTINYVVTADIKDVLARENISFKVNGISSLNYTYNPATDSFEGSVVLIPGTNTFEIIATNTCGSDTETINVNYLNCVSPVISMVNPSMNGTSVSSAPFTLSALIQNVTTAQGIILTHNNASITNYSFNSSTGGIQSTVTLTPGLNTFVLTTSNSCGSDSETITVNYQNCVAPVISLVSSNSNTVSTENYILNALILNSNNGQDLKVTFNGVPVTNYSFNNGTGALQSNFTLKPGLNTFVITSTNSCGTDAETFTVNYQRCLVPVISMVNPSVGASTVSNPSYTINATIQNTNNGQGITLTQNGTTISNYSFNSSVGALQGTVTLVPGTNTFVLTSVNSCGTDSETFTITFTQAEQKITICHYPPGNTGNPQTIEIPLSAWPAHQAHGDKLGPCPVIETNTPEEKITICHYPPGNIGNPQTIEIPLSAWPAHQAHGDKLGPCPVIETNTPEEKITICHYPPGNIGNPQTIEIPLSAWPAHQAHGDKLGPCPVIETNTPEEKITICHYPPGNIGNPQTIEIPLSAWPAHQAHGDKLGPCPTVETLTPEEKITICHYPPGNIGNPQTIEIPLSAWPAHQAHGDKLGPCPVIETNTPEEKITICHYPPGNIGNPQTIEIPLSAWPAHQAHGDKLGPCPVIETNTPEEKITICHYPPGNIGNPQTIEIPLSAWPAHEAHGDKLGPCPTVEDTPEEKITICHYPPGNNRNPQTIEIPLSAWPAHQAHGDKLGPCPSDENGDGNGNNGHGNNSDGIDSSNPGQGNGGPNGGNDGNGDDENGNSGGNGNHSVNDNGTGFSKESQNQAAKEAARLKLEQDQKRAAEDAKRAADEAEMKRKADENAKEAARIKAEQEERRQAEEAKKRADEAEAKRKAEEAAREKADQEAKRRADEAAREKADQEAKQRAEEAERKAEAAKEAARIKAEQDAKKAEEEVKRKAAEEERKKAEEAEKESIKKKAEEEKEKGSGGGRGGN